MEKRHFTEIEPIAMSVWTLLKKRLVMLAIADISRFIVNCMY